MMKWLLLLFFYPLIVYGTKGDCNTHFEDDKKHILPISKRGDVNIQKIPRKNPSGEMESSLYKNQTQNTMVSEDDNPFLPPVKKSRIRNYSRETVMNNLQHLTAEVTVLLEAEHLLPNWDDIIKMGFLNKPQSGDQYLTSIAQSESPHMFNIPKRVFKKSRLFAPEYVKRFHRESEVYLSYGPLPHLPSYLVSHIHVDVIPQLGEAIVLLSDRVANFSQAQVQSLTIAQILLIKEQLKITQKGRFLTDRQLELFLTDDKNQLIDLHENPLVFAPQISQIILSSKHFGSFSHIKYSIIKNAVSNDMIPVLNPEVFSISYFIKALSPNLIKSISEQTINNLNQHQKEILVRYARTHFSIEQLILFRELGFGTIVNPIINNVSKSLSKDTKTVLTYTLSTPALNEKEVSELTREEVMLRLPHFEPYQAGFFKVSQLVPLYEEIDALALFDKIEVQAIQVQNKRVYGKLKYYSPKKIRTYPRASKVGMAYGPLPYLPKEMVPHLKPEVLRDLEKAIELLSDKIHLFRQNQLNSLASIQINILNTKKHSY